MCAWPLTQLSLRVPALSLPSPEHRSASPHPPPQLTGPRPLHPVSLSSLSITLHSINAEKSELSVFLKLLLTHLQLMALVASFPLNWPPEVQSFFQLSQSMADAPSQLFSLDCLVLSFSTLPRFFVYLLFYSLLSLALILLSYSVWACISCCSRRSASASHTYSSDIRAKSFASVLLLLLVFHPSISTTVFQVFHCKQISSSSYLVEELSLECWAGRQLYWSLGLGVPTLLLVVVGFPLTALISLREKAQEGSLSTRITRLQFGFLYKGYRRAAYFWEVLTILRKTSIAFVSVFLVSAGAKVQAFVLLALLCGFALLTFYSRPFTSSRLNFL